MPALLKGPLLTERSARRWGWAIITVLVLVVHWPLSTFTCAMGGGDAFDCWLPWRHFMTLALQNGELPLWNPLQQMGYPVHADLQGPMWYPEAIAIGGTIGHSVITLQVLYLFYVIIGGVGLMRLCNTVHGDARVGVIAGSLVSTVLGIAILATAPPLPAGSPPLEASVPGVPGDPGDA